MVGRHVHSLLKFILRAGGTPDSLIGRNGAGLAVDLTSVPTTLTNVLSGAYTPTLTAVANIAASGAFEIPYARVGDFVIMAGGFTADPTAAGGATTQLGISIPIASDFSSNRDAGGTVFALSVQSGAGIYADITNNRLEARWACNDANNIGFYFIASYRIR